MSNLDYDQTLHDLTASLTNFKTVQKLFAAGESEFETAKILLEASIVQLEKTKKEFLNQIEVQKTSGNHAGI